MFSHPELGSDPPIRSDRESGCDSSSPVRLKKASSVPTTFVSISEYNGLTKRKMTRFPIHAQHNCGYTIQPFVGFML